MILGILALSSIILAEDVAPFRVVNLLDDTRFQRGFTVWDPAPGKHIARGTLPPSKAEDEPVWGLAQWHSRFSLAGAEAERLPSGALRFFDGAKAVTFGPPDSPEADLILALDARTEYQNRVREPDEAWPHLLAERELLHHPSLAELQAVRFRLSYRLLKSETAKPPGFDPRLHAAQFLFYITVQNRNRQSSGFGDYLWFGLQPYDSRYRLPSAHAAADFSTPQKKGTGKFIFHPDMKRLTQESTHDGAWVCIDADLMPFIREAVEMAWKRGYLSDSHDLTDYCLGGMNMGWEVTGPFDVAVQIKDLKLEAMVAVDSF